MQITKPDLIGGLALCGAVRMQQTMIIIRLCIIITVNSLQIRLNVTKAIEILRDTGLFRLFPAVLAKLAANQLQILILKASISCMVVLSMRYLLSIDQRSVGAPIQCASGCADVRLGLRSSWTCPMDSCHHRLRLGTWLAAGKERSGGLRRTKAGIHRTAF